jgi:hypothetical protein
MTSVTIVAHTKTFLRFMSLLLDSVAAQIAAGFRPGPLPSHVARRQSYRDLQLAS